MGSCKKRLDLALVEKGYAESRQRAQALIMAGKILVNDRPIDKPGVRISEVDHIILKGDDIPYVSRGGVKLEAALNAFQIDPKGLICLDVGASTGGFTDCLLQHGAKSVYAVDVGYGQLAWKLRTDSRVTVIERTNIRHMPAGSLPQAVDLVTIDVSFISLRIVVPSVVKFMRNEAKIIPLIKPQFEVGKEYVGKGGVVRDLQLHEAVIADLTAFFSQQKFQATSVIPSPIKGPKGNREYFVCLIRQSEPRYAI